MCILNCWHLKETKHLQQHETLEDANECVHGNPPLKQLIKRCNLEAMTPKMKRLTLSFSKGKVNIPCRDARDCVVSLLTDPRAKDKHHPFCGENPVTPPPEEMVCLEDMNAGEAMLESHKCFVKKPNQATLGIKFYIDGANTGQFSDLNSCHRSEAWPWDPHPRVPILFPPSLENKSWDS